jgi:hypothetical protein
MKTPILKTGMAGLYKLQAVKVSTGETRNLTGWFNNLITNTGLDRIGQGTYLDRCGVGASSQAPAFTDTALIAQVGPFTSTVENTTTGASSETVEGVAHYYGFFRRRWRFAAGSVAGNLSEVATGWSGGIFSRALIRDEGGNPTTITVLEDEFLDVTYELRAYAPLADIPFSVVADGVTYTGVARAANVTSSGWAPDAQNGAVFGGATGAVTFSGEIGPITGSPTASISSATSVSPAAYMAGSYQRTCTATWSLNQGATPVASMQLSGTHMGIYQFSFAPEIPKTSTKILTCNFTLSWGRRAS